MAEPIHVRKLRMEDLSAIVDMENRATGVARRAYWEARIDISEAIHPHWASLVAEMDNRVVGFLFGRVGSELEFGLPGTVAWIEIIGVDPTYRRVGIAAKLLRAFTSQAVDHGIKKILTLVSKDHTEMGQFFTWLGYTQGQMIHFQKDLQG